MPDRRLVLQAAQVVERTDLGEFEHIFSHIRQLVAVQRLVLRVRRQSLWPPCLLDPLP